MSLIEIRNLTFAYPGSFDNVFEGLNLRLDTSWRLGLVGRNGRGKTTLLRLLLGEYEYSGAISAPAELAYFPPRVAHPEADTRTVLEELAPGLEEWRLLRELAALEVDEGVLDRPFSTLSGGEQVKALLSVLFLREGAFPLLDEPTNHLDLEGRQLVSRWLSRKEGFLLISHDRAFLDGCVDHIAAINKKDVEVRQGDFSAWWRDKQARDDWERAENSRLKKEIGRLEDAARRTASWSDRVEATKKGSRNAGLRPDRGYIGHKAAKMMKRSKAAQARREEAVQAKSALLKNIELAEELKLHPLTHPKNRLVEARDAAPDYGNGPVCAPVSFTVERGEVAALTGRNGCGKSSLLKLACGEDIPHTGLFALASGLVVSWVPQDASFLRGSLRDFIRDSGVDETLCKAILRKLDFSRAQFDKDMADYSAGQKKKVLLARSLCQSAHLYVWDEPLNYIDVFSRMQLERLLQAYHPAMLLVEHDRAFLDGLADKLVPLHAGSASGGR